jgi:hypothetical protein
MVRAALSVLLLLLVAHSVRAYDRFGPLAFIAHVADRSGKPLAGVRVRIDAHATGVRRDISDRLQPVELHCVGVATTDRDGVARLVEPPPPLCDAGDWFQGSRRVCARIDDPGRELLTVDRRDGEQGTITVFEEPDRIADGFPIWYGHGARHARVCVLIEAFDIGNTFRPVDTLRLCQDTTDFLRAAGIAVLVVSFPDSHQPPDQQSETVARAIRAGASVSGQPVTVLGLSIGGIAARWALCAAENVGKPLPVRGLFLLDSPNRGATVPPALLALTWRYAPAFRTGLASPAARAVLRESIEDPARAITWRQIGLPLLGRRMPVAVRTTGQRYEEFFDRLRGLNGNRGYPTACPVFAVANGARHRPSSDAETVFHVWLPFGYYWNVPSTPTDRAPGSKLMRATQRFAVRLPLGIAGGYFRSLPTFVATASALDADSDEAPPFADWYARSDDLPALSHDVIDAAASRWVARRTLRLFLESER